MRELDRTIVLGDDLTVTNMELLKKAHALKAVEGFVLKPNQVGTISEALDAWRFAQGARDDRRSIRAIGRCRR